MPLISHRGAAHLANANSKEAIQAGDHFKPAYIEIDINCTSDDVLVLYHGSVKRFMHGKKMKESISQVRSRTNDTLLLDELSTLATSSPYLFDIKIADDASLLKIEKHIRESSYKGFSFTSPHEKALKHMKKAFPEALILQSQPYHHGPVSALELARKNNFGGVMLNKWWLTPLVYWLCRAHGKEIGVYTIDSALGMMYTTRFFPRAYLVTNRPHIYRKMYPSH